MAMLCRNGWAECSGCMACQDNTAAARCCECHTNLYPGEDAHGAGGLHFCDDCVEHINSDADCSCAYCGEAIPSGTDHHRLAGEPVCEQCIHHEIIEKEANYGY